MQLFINDTASITGSVTSLPAYTRRESPPPRLLNEHITQLSHNPTDKNSKPWITLTLMSNARDAKSPPIYVEGDRIAGFVNMDAGENGDGIHTVKVIVRGELTTGRNAEDGITFLDSSQILWCKDNGGSRQARLSGPHEWSFSFSLPKTVNISASPGNTEGRLQFPLPPTVVERHTRAKANSDTIVGKGPSFLVPVQASQAFPLRSLSTIFVYIPATRPSPSSPLRQLSYQEQSPLFGPESDPEGWLTLPPVKIQGTLFSARQTEVICHLSLANPLCYTRGSVIPLSLLFTSKDTQALDLFTKREAIDIRLRRHVSFRHEVIRAELNWRPSIVNLKHKPHEDSATAVWWLSSEGSRETEDGWMSRRMNGEITLPKSLKPSCEIAHFRISYTVALIPFDTPGFQLSSHSVNVNDLAPLLERRVEIATMFPRGPRPVSFAPPHATGSRRHKLTSVRPTSAHARA
ncbi:hypothetical protein V5O48_002421 [Marasmius crinis-equi]|uniref:Arrestin-like N-terminal domain-containing protein n=1 Tax=Marasmius crinis-equi TaxID=585013 RepID=A0ABR3FW25_9AGAR